MQFSYFSLPGAYYYAIAKGPKLLAKRYLKPKHEGVLKPERKKYETVFSRLTLDVPIPYCNVKSWFAIALAEIRTRLIVREKADCKQYNVEPKKGQWNAN